ncbi:MAG: hypothetical protein KF744_09030 [Taibaiella sp.]|nr:hypothetical protein [Taibaiella sp.]
MIIWFDSNCVERVMTATTARAKIAAIQGVIDTLLEAAAAAALNSDMQEYSFDNGQTKTRVIYKDVNAIVASIKGLMALQQLYLQMPGMNNRVVRLIDSKNFTNYFPVMP